MIPMLAVDSPETKLLDMDFAAVDQWHEMGATHLNLHVNSSDVGSFWYNLEKESVRFYAEYWLGLGPNKGLNICLWEEETAEPGDQTAIIEWSVSVFGDLPNVMYYVEELPRNRNGFGEAAEAVAWAEGVGIQLLQADPDSRFGIHNQRDWYPWDFAREPNRWEWLLQAATVDDFAPLIESTDRLRLRRQIAELTDPLNRGDSSGIPSEADGGVAIAADLFEQTSHASTDYWVYAGDSSDGCGDSSCSWPGAYTGVFRRLQDFQEAQTEARRVAAESILGLSEGTARSDLNQDGIIDAADTR